MQFNFLIMQMVFPTYVNHFPTNETGYHVTDFEFSFDETTFPENETDFKNMNCKITCMQMSFLLM